MNRRFLLMLTLALMLALLAAWVANQWIKGREVSAQAVPVVVAAVEVPFGVKLEEAHVRLISWPEKTAPAGSFPSKDKVIGRITMNKFYPDEIITEKRISEHLGGSTLSAMISKESRALSVRVDDVVGVAGFILPGNKIDVLATKMDRMANKATTRTLLQNIKVLAVDQEASQEKEKPAIVRAVTLELTPEQAEVIVQAMQEGKIQLTLRNPLDDSVEAAPAPVKVAEVRPKPVIKRISAPKRTLKIIPW